MFDTVSVVDKSVLKEIPDMVRECGSKMEVYNRLKDKIPGYQNNSLARRIAAVTTEETRSKNKIPVLLLILQTVISVIFAIANLIKFVPANMFTTPILIIAALYLIVTALFIYGYASCKLFVYSTAISLYSLSVAVTLALMLFKPETKTAISLFSSAIILVFLTLLRKSIFPEITFWGNVKPDKETDFKFSS